MTPVSIHATFRTIRLTSVLLCLGVLPPTLTAQSQAGAKTMADGKQWTTRNLDVNLTPSYCYGNVDANCQSYGRLYTWDSARRACQTLGSSWRLPTDQDWRQLAKAYGGVSADSEDRGKKAYQALMPGGASGFNAQLGGGREASGQFARLEAHGFYWTATEETPAAVWYYNFGKGGLALHRQSGGEKPEAFAVRCVKD